MEKKEFYNSLKLYESKTTIALLPGSRKQEIENILPLMLKASAIIQENRQDIQFVVVKSNQVDWDTYHHITHNSKLNLKVVEGKTYDCLNIADFCLVCSGTATVETAIMQKPFVIVYKMNILNYLLYRPQVRIPYIGMVNIVAGKKIIPEFVQFGACPRKIAREALKILKTPSETERMKNNLAQVKTSLGEKGATSRAAQIIVDFLNKTS
jgi:lipid-A-disaccharide synthase